MNAQGIASTSRLFSPNVDDEQCCFRARKGQAGKGQAGKFAPGIRPVGVHWRGCGSEPRHPSGQKALSVPLTRNDRRLIRSHSKPYTLCRAAAAALFQISFRSEITINLTPRAIEPPNAVHKARRCAITGPGALASESRKTMYPVMKVEYSA
jgi:hypothetical protein